MKIDVSKPYGEVAGKAPYRYEQNNCFYDSSGRRVMADGSPMDKGTALKELADAKKSEVAEAEAAAKRVADEQKKIAAEAAAEAAELEAEAKALEEEAKASAAKAKPKSEPASFKPRAKKAEIPD
jgi:hypothetical protein